LYQTLLRDSSLFALLLRFDEDLAAEARRAGCAMCGGTLHSACFRRKPRGGPEGLAAPYKVRQSFCCAREGCRRRVTPPSLRFLGRKVYFGVWVLLLPALQDGPTPRRMSRIEEEFAVSRRTLLRWRRWWREAVAHSRFWQSRRGDWSLPVATETLPASLLGGFSHIAPLGLRVVAVLRWLLPLAGHDGKAFERGQ
jgi:hypothetical protein